MTFHDHFSDASAAYRQARPTYPEALFVWLASASPSRTLAWDCGCGNGQATLPLGAHFEKVIGTDASARQLEQADRAPNVEYRIARAEASGLEDASVDLCTVAQAAHWFDHRAFDREVRRVLRPAGLLAYFTYGIHHVSPEVDAIVGRYYTEIVGPYWPPERIHVDQHYANLPFPFAKIESPRMQIERDWTQEQLLAYLATWSASKEYYKAMGNDPRGHIGEELHEAWGDRGRARHVTWPLTIVAGYHEG